jgi:predicted transcriptional regulator of viral defense system
MLAIRPVTPREGLPRVLAAAVRDPSYVGWWSAAAFHGFTSQASRTVFIATERRIPDRAIEGTPVRFVNIPAARSFGWQQYELDGGHVPFSAPAKTLIDCLYRPNFAGGAVGVTQIVSRALEIVSAEEAVDAALRFRSKSLMQRLGAIADLVGRPLSGSARHRLRASIPRSARSRFGRGKALAGDVGYVSRWGLFIDAARAELLAELRL